MEVSLRKAGLHDLDDVFAWRNDPLVRQMGKNSEPVSYEEHMVWFKKSLDNPERLMLIGEAVAKIGIVRFDYKQDGVWEISLYTAPPARGKGLGNRLLSLGLLHLEIAVEPKKVLAEIREDNAVSRALFKRFDFREQKIAQGFVSCELKIPRMGPLSV